MAYDGPTALELVHRRRPDLVLLDIGLPGMDGYEVARRCRQDETLRPIMLVAMTGYGKEEDRRRSQEAGFNAHLVKPVNLEDLQVLLTSARSDDAGPLTPPSRRMTRDFRQPDASSWYDGIGTAWRIRRPTGRLEGREKPHVHDRTDSADIAGARREGPGPGTGTPGTFVDPGTWSIATPRTESGSGGLYSQHRKQRPHAGQARRSRLIGLSTEATSPPTAPPRPRPDRHDDRRPGLGRRTQPW